MAPRKDPMKRIASLVLVILLSSIFSSCNKEVKVPEDEFYEEWRTLAKTSQPTSPSDTEVIVDLPQKEEELAQQTKEAAEQRLAPKALPTDPVSMTMRETDVNVILRALARIVNQNIMMNKEVSGVTNINVVEAPWDEVFGGILRIAGTYVYLGKAILLES